MTARKKQSDHRAARTSAARNETPRSKKAAAKRPTKSRNRKARRPAPLERLRSDESTQLLLSLALRHPELQGEIDDLALALIGSVDAESVGTELGRRLRELDIFDATDTAPRDGRYVPMWEAADQTLEGLLEPYLADLQRRIELGLKEAAQSMCLGIVLGLYHARDYDSDDSLLAHAPDFCENEAHFVVGQLAKQSSRLHRRRWLLPEAARELLPDWQWLFPRGASRKRRR